MLIAVINGPNINMLGLREPGIYGKETYGDLKEKILGRRPDAEIFQSNHEGEIIDKIQSLCGRDAAIIINAGGYSHTSVAIPDALRAVNLPTVEVHITDIYSREEYRRHSFVSEAAEKVICGHGTAGYIEAIDYLEQKYGK